MAARAFPFLLRPTVFASRNRARRRQRGDSVRGGVFGLIGLGVAVTLFGASFWLTWQLLEYAELGDYLLRIGLAWLFLTFLSFLTFSGIVTALSTFYLSEDLKLLMATPVSPRRLFHARFARTLGQASWMVVVFLVPVLAGVGLARCAGPWFYVTAVATVAPFATIPVALGAGVTLLLVNVFPARRARDLLMLMGLLFAASLVVLLRVVRPERLLRVESLPDLSAFFATLQSPVTPFLPSFWAGETLFASLMGGADLLRLAALWTTAGAAVVLLGAAHERWFFSGFSKAQEARKARFTRYRIVDIVAGMLPLSPSRRHLLIKDLKVFLRDVAQWSQLLLLVALVAVYLFNFRVLDLERVPYMSGVIKNLYAFVNLGLAGFVMATVCARFVFPAVSIEGPAFWIVRTSPVRLRDFLWAKFWAGLLPVLVLAVVLTVVGNHFLGADPFLKKVTALAVVLMTVALVGLGTGLGARYPRFNAENVNQIAGSYGGVLFMVTGVLYVIVMLGLTGWPSSVYLWHELRGRPIDPGRAAVMAACAASAVALSAGLFWYGMRSGVKALEEMG